MMRKGVTQLCTNDMLVMTSPLIMQDHNPTLWFSENGQRLGTYVGHNGSVNTCDVSSESPHGHLDGLSCLTVPKRSHNIQAQFLAGRDGESDALVALQWTPRGC